MTGMVNATERRLPVATYWHHKKSCCVCAVHRVYILNNMTLQRDNIEYLLPFSTVKRFSSQIALEKLFGLGCCPWIRDQHRYYSCVYILDEIEGIPIPFGGLNTVEMGWKVILYSSAVQLGFLKASIVTSHASLLKTQNYYPK